MAHAERTDGSDYTQRLLSLGQPGWKKVLRVQAPYRWNIRRLLGGRYVLDVGCGVGRNLAHLDGGGIGVDHNPHSVEACRAGGLTAFTTEEFPGTDKARSGAFTGLLAAHVLEHLPVAMASSMLASYLPYLADGGRAVLICPQERGYATDRTHTTYFDLDRLSDLARQLGLRVDATGSFPLPRIAGRAFPYNEFVLVATKLQDARGCC